MNMGAKVNGKRCGCRPKHRVKPKRCAPTRKRRYPVREVNEGKQEVGPDRSHQTWGNWNKGQEHRTGHQSGHRTGQHEHLSGHRTGYLAEGHRTGGAAGGQVQQGVQYHYNGWW